MTRTVTKAIGPDFAVPIEQRYFEDYQAGAVYEYGYRTVTETEILEFAQLYDPQRIHVDPEYAATGPFGGLIASGCHSFALFIRIYADHYLSKVAALVSPGGDELRWPEPLRPGDAVRLRTTTVETRVSRSKPDRGLLRTKCELITTTDERAVFSLTAVNFLKLRSPA